MDWPATKRLAKKQFDGLSSEVQSYFTEIQDGEIISQNDQKAAHSLYISSLRFLTQCCSLLADSTTPLAQELIQSIDCCCHGFSVLCQAAAVDDSKVINGLKTILYIFSKLLGKTSVSAMISLSTSVLNLLKMVTTVEGNDQFCELTSQFYKFMWNSAILFDRQMTGCSVDICQARFLSIRVLACQPSKRESCVEKLYLAISIFDSQCKPRASAKRKQSSAEEDAEHGRSNNPNPKSSRTSKSGSAAKSGEGASGGETDSSDTQQAVSSVFLMILTALEEMVPDSEIQAATLVKLTLTVFDLLTGCRLSHHQGELKDKLFSLTGASGGHCSGSDHLVTRVLNFLWDMVYIVQFVLGDNLKQAQASETQLSKHLSRLLDWCKQLKLTASADELRCFIELIHWFGKQMKAGKIRTDIHMKLDSVSQLLQVFEHMQSVFAENNNILTVEADDSGTCTQEWRDKVTKAHLGAHRCWVLLYHKAVSEHRNSLETDAILGELLAQAKHQLAAYTVAMDRANHSPALEQSERYFVGSICVRLGHLFYNEGQDEEAMPYYSLSCEQLSVWCQADPALRTTRLKETSLMKLYNCLSQSLHKVKGIDDAMATIVKAVTMCGEECKDDLPSLMKTWLKLKRSASREEEHLEKRLSRCMVDEGQCSVDTLHHYILLELSYLLKGPRLWLAETFLVQRLHDTTSKGREKDFRQLLLMQCDILTNHPVTTPRQDIDSCLDTILEKYPDSVVIQVEACLLRFCIQVKDKLERPVSEVPEEEHTADIPKVGNYEKMIGEEEKALVRSALKVWKTAVGEEGVESIMDQVHHVEGRLMQDLLMMVADVLRACREFLLQLEVVSIMRQISLHSPWEDDRQDVLVTVLDSLTDLGVQDLPPALKDAIMTAVNHSKEAGLADKGVETLQLSLASFYVQAGQMEAAGPILNQLRDRELKGELGSLHRGKFCRLMSQCLPDSTTHSSSQLGYSFPWVLNAYRYHFSLFSRTSATEALRPSSGSGGMDSLWYKLVELLESTLCLGRMYRHTGDARRAKCYLKEGLMLCTKFGLLKWSTLFGLEVTELMSDMETLPSMVQVLTSTYLNLSRIEPPPEVPATASLPPSAAFSQPTPVPSVSKCKQGSNSGKPLKRQCAVSLEAPCKQRHSGSSDDRSSVRTTVQDLAENCRKVYEEEQSQTVKQGEAGEVGFWQKVQLYSKCEEQKRAETSRKMLDLVSHVLSWSMSLTSHHSSCWCLMCTDPHSHHLALTLTKTSVKVIHATSSAERHMEKFLSKILKVFPMRDVSGRVVETLQSAQLLGKTDSVQCRDWSVLQCWADLSTMLAQSALLHGDLPQVHTHVEAGLMVLKHLPQHLPQVLLTKCWLVHLYTASLHRSVHIAKPFGTGDWKDAWYWLTETQLNVQARNKLMQFSLKTSQQDKKTEASGDDVVESSHLLMTSGSVEEPGTAPPDIVEDNAKDEESSVSSDQCVTVLADNLADSKSNISSSRSGVDISPYSSTDSLISGKQVRHASLDGNMVQRSSIKNSKSVTFSHLSHPVSPAVTSSKLPSSVSQSVKVIKPEPSSTTAVKSRTGKSAKNRSATQSRKKPGPKVMTRDSSEDAVQQEDLVLFTEESVATQLFSEEPTTQENKMTVNQTPKTIPSKQPETPSSAIHRTLSFVASLSDSGDEFQCPTPMSTPRHPGKGGRTKAVQHSERKDSGKPTTVTSTKSCRIPTSRGRAKQGSDCVKTLQDQFSQLNLADGTQSSSTTPALEKTQQAPKSRTGKKGRPRNQTSAAEAPASVESLQQDLALLDLSKEASSTSPCLVLEDPQEGASGSVVCDSTSTVPEHTGKRSRGRQGSKRGGGDNPHSVVEQTVKDNRGRQPKDSGDTADSVDSLELKPRRGRGKVTEGTEKTGAKTISHGKGKRVKGTHSQEEKTKVSTESEHTETKDQQNTSRDDTMAVTDQKERWGRGRKTQENVDTENAGIRSVPGRKKQNKGLSPRSNNNTNIPENTPSRRTSEKTVEVLPPVLEEQGSCTISLCDQHKRTGKDDTGNIKSKSTCTVGIKQPELNKVQSTVGRKATRGGRKPKDTEKPQTQIARERRGAGGRSAKVKAQNSVSLREVVVDRETLRGVEESDDCDTHKDVFDFIDSDDEGKSSSTTKKPRSTKTPASRTGTVKTSRQASVKRSAVKNTDRISCKGVASRTKTVSHTPKPFSHTPRHVSHTPKPVSHTPKSISHTLKPHCCSTAKKTGNMKEDKGLTDESSNLRQSTQKASVDIEPKAFTAVSDVSNLHTDLSSMESLRMGDLLNMHTAPCVTSYSTTSTALIKADTEGKLAIDSEVFHCDRVKGIPFKESVLSYFQREGKVQAMGDEDDKLGLLLADGVSASPEQRAMVLEKLQAWLSENLRLTQLFPHVTLSGESSKLLAQIMLDQGDDPWHIAALLGESAAVSLRHQFLGLHQKHLRAKDIEERQKHSVNQLKEDFQQLLFPWDMHRYQQVVQSLPKGWTVCQLSVVDTPGCPVLLLTRLTCDQEPLTVELPRFSDEKGQSIYFGFLDILKVSDQAQKIKENGLWWHHRAVMDTRMANVLEGMEKYWLGPWKGMLAGQTSDAHYNTAMATAASKLINVLRQRLDLTCCQGKARQILELMQHTKDLATVLSGVLQLDNIRDNTQLLNAITSDILEVMPKVKDPDLPVILILDKHLANFPMEQLAVMRKQAVTRVPSLALLHLLLKNHGVIPGNKDCVHSSEAGVMQRGIDPKSVFYLLNPDGDLYKSHELLKTPYESFDSWKGLSGEVPTKEQYEQALTQHDMFVYSGHGSGCKYFSSEDLLKMKCRAVPLLFGCSSVKLDVHPNLDSEGYFYSYLLAGSPCVMGNLWDVTDRDTDTFGLQIFHLWLKEKGGATQPSLASLVQQARSVCRMQWLNGGAPVLYGLPVPLLRPPQ